MIYESILSTIGGTPIVRINRLAPAHVTMYVKCEFFNPLGSVKDRLAIAIIEDAERTGAIERGQTVVEATSGNTGIALAMVCAAKGYPFVAVMAESFSIERRKIMRMLGAKVILTPAAERGTGMVRKAEELAKKHGWFLARQFENPANPAYHRNTTGPEILRDFAGRRLDYFVTGWGTGGTLTGRRCSPASRSHPTRSRAGRRISCPRCSIGAFPRRSSPFRMRRPSRPRARSRAARASSAAFPRGPLSPPR
jgi:cysteine synthase A